MTWSLLLAAQYAVLLLLLGASEWRRHGRGVDPTSVFTAIVGMQCVVPALGLHLTMPYVDRFAPTGNAIFDHILRQTSFVDGELVFVLLAWFLLAFRITANLVAGPPRSESPGTEHGAKHLDVRAWALVPLLLAGFLLTIHFFVGLGDSVLERYASLVLYRAGHPAIARTALRENAFLLIQAWSWLTVLCLFVLKDKQARWQWWGTLAMALGFALLSGSRRALFIPLLIGYFAHVMRTGRWYLGRLAVAGVPAVAWVAYGEVIIGALAMGHSPWQRIASADLAPAALYASAEAGVTVVESLGTVNLIDLPPRWGSDHLLSLLRRVPDQAMGVTIDFPERMVRVSTSTFGTANDLDIPPGFMGQMWLDFRALGPLLWGAAFGVVVGALTRLHRQLAPSRTNMAVLSLVTFLIALPVNSGTLDFNVTQDTMLMYLVLALLVRWRGPMRQRYPAIP